MERSKRGWSSFLLTLREHHSHWRDLFVVYFFPRAYVNVVYDGIAQVILAADNHGDRNIVSIATNCLSISFPQHQISGLAVHSSGFNFEELPPDTFAIFTITTLTLQCSLSNKSTSQIPRNTYSPERNVWGVKLRPEEPPHCSLGAATPIFQHVFPWIPW